jgi:hypothetical protein
VRIRGGERSLPRASSLDSVAPAAALSLWLCLLLKFRCVAWGWCDRAGVGISLLLGVLTGCSFSLEARAGSFGGWVQLGELPRAS